METQNIDLMRRAREALKGKWALAIGTFIVNMLLAGSWGSIERSASLISLVLAGPLSLGAAIFSISLARGKEAMLEQLFQGFKRFGTALGAYLLMMLYVLLWTLLFIIPGVIAALSYSLTFYILADDESIKAEDALKKSKVMMNGYKMKLFKLYLRFFLLSLLCILTLGIGFLWLIPYANITMAFFYDDVKGNEVNIN